MCSNVEQRKDDAGSKQAACGYSQTKQYKQWQKPGFCPILPNIDMFWGLVALAY